MHIATDGLSLFFIVCFLIGLFYLVLAALLGGWGHGHVDGQGHIGDAVHTGHTIATHGGAQVGHAHAHAHGQAHGSNFSIFSVLNPMSIMLFLLAFGLFGYVFLNIAPLALPFVFLIAVVGGIVIATFILSLISRIFGTGEATTEQDITDRTGLVGKVSMTIRENSLGEVIYISPGGMRKSIPARSTDGRKIERDQEVVVVSYQKGIAEVDTWEHFVNQEEVGELQAPDAETMDQLRILLDEMNSTDSKYASRKEAQKE